MPSKPTKPPQPVDTTPADFPVQPQPRQLPGADYSYTVELVATIHNQLGKLTEAIDTLKGSIKAQGEKLDSVARDVHSAKVIMRVVIGIIIFLGGIGGIVLKAFFDYFLRTHVPQK
jgi:hypothetical protein